MHLKTYSTFLGEENILNPSSGRREVWFTQGWQTVSIHTSSYAAALLRPPLRLKTSLSFVKCLNFENNMISIFQAAVIQVDPSPSFSTYKYLVSFFYNPSSSSHIYSCANVKM